MLSLRNYIRVIPFNPRLRERPFS